MPILSSSRLRLKLQTRLMLAFAFVVLIQAAITGGITHSYIQVILENRIGEQALPILSSSRLRLKLQTRLMLAFAFVVLLQAPDQTGLF